MKKGIIMVAMLLATVSVSAQFYMSASGGYSIPSAGVKFGTETTPSGVKNTYGSYGEGLHTQLRGGYFFNDKFGVEVGLGYLYGADQTILKVSGIPSQPEVDIKSRGRAYGASASFVYKFTNNIYGRFGALIKVGGKTEAVGTLEGISLPAGAIPNLPISTTLDVNFTQDYKGRLPLGFIGAIGYKYDVASNVSLFAELEYMGISVTRDTSSIAEFSASLREVPGSSLSLEQVRGILAAGGNPLANSLYDNIEYVDELPLNNTDATKQLSQKVPYSSFGINIGVTYTFGK
ncbi:outer membrane beta-barrel protein [Tenacibaculum maritimum]|uniref:outer membrane beta-barrel protein n=1 Tax=Tenacibaculum maritimum TaxID=107401 RepID=UPI003875C0D4